MAQVTKRYLLDEILKPGLKKFISDNKIFSYAVTSPKNLKHKIPKCMFRITNKHQIILNLLKHNALHMLS